MSKKPVPGLMGNAKLLSGFSSQEVNVGARRITRIVRPGESDLFQGALDADSLFNTAFGEFDVILLLNKVREAGFPEYPAPGTPSEREAIAERYTGAAPNIENPKDIRASLAWVLVRLAEFEYLHQRYISENNFGGVFFAGVRMGNLSEWWRCRSKGHDAEAVSRQSSTAILKTSMANIDRADAAKEWHAEARAAADRIRKQKPYLKGKSRVAKLVIKELQSADPTFDKSERTVRRVI